MNEFQLKYGCNPNQKPSRIFMEDGSGLPVEILNGRPGYINFLDAFNGYQLVKELKEATGLPAATSFKHVSPAGAAVGLPLSEVEKKIYWVDENIGELSPLACAYARARGADRMSSLVISYHYQMNVMLQQQSLSSTKYQMVLSLLVSQMKL